MRKMHFVATLGTRGMLNWLPDKAYLKMVFKEAMGYPLDLENPKTFNEKLQWLKLYDRKTIYTTMVDKYEAKKYVADIIGEEYIIPTLGVWEKFDDIDFSSLPDQFVLKCTHDSGGLVICKDKESFNIQEARKKINESLNRNYFWLGREWPYKDIKPRIIAEQYMEDEKTHELRDYKFFCFNGIVKCFKVDFDRFIEHRANYYDTNNNLLRFGETICPPDFERTITIPDTINEMIQLAERLAEGISFLRVDFYDVSGNVFFGELTFFPASGFGSFIPDDYDTILGSWIALPTH